MQRVSLVHASINPSPASCGWGVFVWILAFGVSPGATFELLGDLPGARLNGSARGISANGSVVVGSGENAAGDTAAWVWTATSGMVQLPFLSGNQNSRANGVSDDGSKIVGEAENSIGRDQAVIWTRQAGGNYTIQALNPPNGSKFGNIVTVDMNANAISGDGLTVVGKGRTNESSGTATPVFEAFYWTNSEGVVPMGNLIGAPSFGNPPKASFSEAFGVDRMGQLATGKSRSGLQANGTSVNSEAYRFNFATDTMTGVGDLQTPVAGSDAYAISKDGTTLTGQARDPLEGQVAFRQTEASGMVSIGDLPGGTTVAIGFAISADGRVIAGRGAVAQDVNITNNTSRAFIWSENLGLQNLATVAGLTATELGPKGFLEDALAISDDGLTVVGTYGDSGRNPGGNPPGDPNPGSDDTQQTPDRQAFLITFTAEELALNGLGVTPQDLVDESDLSIQSNGTDTALSFQFREDLAFVYTLQYSPDLSIPFANQVTFTPDGNGGFVRSVVTSPYDGVANFADPVLTETLNSPGSKGFWRLQVSAP